MFLALSFSLYHLGLFRFFMNRERLVAWIHSLGAWGFAGFILLQVVQVVAAPIPGEATGVLGGYLYGPVVGVALSTVGLTFGSLLAFSISRFFGRPLTERFVDAKTMERFDYLLHHKGAFLVFLLFLIPGFPKDYLCYILGLGHLTTLEFLSIATTGRLSRDHAAHARGNVPEKPPVLPILPAQRRGGGRGLPGPSRTGIGYRAVLPEISGKASSEEGKRPGGPT